MAGGEGTRLRPMTANQPKPLLPVVNRPIMEHVLRLLKRHGFDETIVTVQFLAALVRNYFGDGEEFGMSLQYATEEMPLGTAGSVRNAEDALRDEPFLCCLFWNNRVLLVFHNLRIRMLKFDILAWILLQ